MRVMRVVKDLVGELAHGGCVDEFMHDQLVVFQTVARGRSEASAEVKSLHRRRSGLGGRRREWILRTMHARAPGWVSERGGQERRHGGARGGAAKGGYVRIRYGAEG
ncbi:hypothetical protein EJ06DRAFT_84785 [Trichodelitschia bisporula]|uniref:RNA 3'-terminal-phosphate cyclase (ATP) n=1 Tax=Trichodelitschia bisporula TaxID=703511 RepID=A0A6G1HRQ9_9PEZI|nr:hypothetical protein EJ06DRAFT_84785 [Trichodelitschia bisporula]